MAKAKRNLKARIKEIDFVIEVADARGPRSTRNPELQELISHRPSMLVLAKADLAQAEATRAWQQCLQRSQSWVVAGSLLDAHDIRQVRSLLMRLTKDLRRRAPRSKASPPRIPGVVMPRIERPEVRGMVIGMPNTGKSSLIRALGGGRVAKGNRPGVTRGIQELSLGDNVTLLDTPGLLWPRALTGETALRLAWLGYAGERAYDAVDAGIHLISWLLNNRVDEFATRYNFNPNDIRHEPKHVLNLIATRFGRGANEIGEVTGAAILLHDFREGLFGPLTLEYPDDDGEN